MNSFLVSHTVGCWAECTISASPTVVWHLLTDAPGWSRWNPAVSVGGTIADGEKITVRENGEKRAFHASVNAPVRYGRRRMRALRYGQAPISARSRAIPLPTTIDSASNSMAWQGGLPLGLFSRIIVFTLTTRNDGAHLLIEEHFSGFLLTLSRVGRKVSGHGWELADWTENLRRAAEDSAT